MLTYEVKYLYSDSTIYGFYKEEKEMSVPKRGITPEKASAFAEMLREMGATHYETSRAHFYEMQTDSTHLKQYIFYK